MSHERRVYQVVVGKQQFTTTRTKINPAVIQEGTGYFKYNACKFA